jgi:hypothetical protein
MLALLAAVNSPARLPSLTDSELNYDEGGLADFGDSDKSGRGEFARAVATIVKRKRDGHVRKVKRLTAIRGGNFS